MRPDDPAVRRPRFLPDSRPHHSKDTMTPRRSSRPDARVAVLGDQLGDALLPDAAKAVQQRAEDNYQHGG